MIRLEQRSVEVERGRRSHSNGRNQVEFSHALPFQDQTARARERRPGASPDSCTAPITRYARDLLDSASIHKPAIAAHIEQPLEHPQWLVAWLTSPVPPMGGSPVGCLAPRPRAMGGVPMPGATPPSVLAGCLPYEPCGSRYSSALLGRESDPGVFSCYRGFRGLALAAFLAFLAWRFSFRLRDATFLPFFLPLSFAMGTSPRTAWDDGHGPILSHKHDLPHRSPVPVRLR